MKKQAQDIKQVTRREIGKTILCFLFCLFMVWLIAGDAVFAFRHPWATHTERFLHLWDAMTFKRIPYQKMRPR